jgi:hypothetical protein
LSGLLLLSACASNDGTVAVDAEWQLTCPAGTGVDCGSLGDTCLGEDAQPGQRIIAGARGQRACDGDGPLIDVSCEAVPRSDGTIFITLRASASEDYAFELDAILGEGTVESRCNVTIFEDGAMYEFGGCVAAPEPTTVERPCQLSNVSTVGSEVAFDLECRPNPIVSETTGFGFNVGAVGGGPATFIFSNCSGF